MIPIARFVYALACVFAASLALVLIFGAAAALLKLSGIGGPLAALIFALMFGIRVFFRPDLPTRLRRLFDGAQPRRARAAFALMALGEAGVVGGWALRAFGGITAGDRIAAAGAALALGMLFAVRLLMKASAPR